VAAPTEEEITGVLARVGKKEGYKACEPLEKRIAKESGRNLRRALLMFEAVHAQKYVVSLSNQDDEYTDMSRVTT
jgi:replication factor C subunit 3/5